MFEAHGSVASAQVIMDRDTGRSKGFGFVEMGSDQEAQAAISALNGQQIGGRAVDRQRSHVPEEWRRWRRRRRWPRRPRAVGGGGGGGGGGGFGGRRRY